jgi:hypothetical protein
LSLKNPWVLGATSNYKKGDKRIHGFLELFQTAREGISSATFRWKILQYEK